MTIIRADCPDMVQGTNFLDGIAGSVTYDTTAGRKKSGLASWSVVSGVGGAAAYGYYYSTTEFTPANSGIRISAWFNITDMPASFGELIQGSSVAIRVTSGGVIRLWNRVADTQIGSDGPTVVAGQNFHLCLAYTTGAGGFVANIKAYCDNTLIASSSPNLANGSWYILFGWATTPGNSKRVNFQHDIVEVDTTLENTFDYYTTAKRAAAGNNNGYDTTNGTGAVNEATITEANNRAHLATAQATQDYTLQTAAVGDVDISRASIVIIGRLAWMWAKSSNTGATYYIVDDGDSATGFATTIAYGLKTKITTSASYPSNAAGIGQKSTGTTRDSYLAECGTIIVYKITGPIGVKAINDTVIASVKALGDLAIGSVKTINNAA